MASDFDLEELISLRTFMGYGQPLADVALSDAQTLMEARLEEMSSDYADAVRTSFLGPLTLHRAALLASHEAMGVASAGKGAFERNANELSERMSLMNTLQLGLCSFVGVPAGPALLSAPSFVSAKAVT